MGKKNWDTVLSRPISLGSWLTNKRIIKIAEVLSKEWRVQAPQSAPQPGGSAPAGQVPRTSSFEGQQSLHTGETEGHRKQRLCSLTVCTRPHMFQVPVKRQQSERSLGQIRLLILENDLERQKATGTLPRDTDTDSSHFWGLVYHKDTGKCHFCVLLLAY